MRELKSSVYLTCQRNDLIVKKLIDFDLKVSCGEKKSLIEDHSLI